MTMNHAIQQEPDNQEWVQQVLSAVSTLRVIIDGNQRVPEALRVCSLACIREGVNILKRWDGRSAV